jgi:ATP-dependent DNA helicase RecG
VQISANKFKQAKRSDIDALLLDKLPKVLDEKQKKHRIKNLLQNMKKQGVINVSGKFWCLFK